MVIRKIDGRSRLPGRDPRGSAVGSSGPRKGEPPRWVRTSYSARPRRADAPLREYAPLAQVKARTRLTGEMATIHSGHLFYPRETPRRCLLEHTRATHLVNCLDRVAPAWLHILRGRAPTSRGSRLRFLTAPWRAEQQGRLPAATELTGCRTADRSPTCRLATTQVRPPPGLPR